ncbi:thrombomodulin-like [Neosynchiropus ocellatus]
MMRILVCALFLCQRAEVGFSDQMICGGKNCYQLHQEAADYRGALKICRNSGAELVTGFGPEVWTLLDGKNGSYWSDAADASMDVCRRVDATDKKTSETRCDAEAHGFVCLLSLNDPCDPLRSDPGAHVRYTAADGAELIHSELVPEGTTALTFKTSREYPDSKHICAAKSWIGAPWNCEVMTGGCEHACNATCVCPPGKVLHSNRFSCAEDPCARCEHRCEGEGSCACRRGYRLLRDGKSCADVDECEETSPCTGDGEQCMNTRGGYECTCMEDYYEFDGKCVNTTLCFSCEHKCEMVNGALACVCHKGFTVSQKDPHKCEMQCTTRDCPARCTQLSDMDEKDWPCTCPRGYILDYRDSKHICTDIDECAMDMYCDQMCENLFGGFRCLCEEGFRLVDITRCVPSRADEGDGSGSEPPHLEVPTAQPAAVPSYVKTGSILGLALFSVLCVALLFFVVRLLAKRCDTLDLPPVKRTEVDIDYLQQVTTDTYKMLPVD